MEDGVVLDRGGDDMVALLFCGGSHPLDRPVVGFRAAGGEEDFLGLCPESLRHLSPRPLHALAGPAGEPVEG
ncbi:hypothetical protein DSECCO2_565140 [anaerobic digester metagenome]